MKQDISLWFTGKEAAVILRMTYRTLKKYCYVDEVIPYRRIGTILLIPSWYVLGVKEPGRSNPTDIDSVAQPKKGLSLRGQLIAEYCKGGDQG